MFTLGTTYYNNPDYLLRFVRLNQPYVDELIVVDDGSSIPLPPEIFIFNKLKIYRVTEDLGFNSHGCRNLIMKEATNEWVILMDVDREFRPVETAYNIIKSTKLNTNCFYKFVAHANDNDSHRSVNDYLINRALFFKAGGYDEELIGYRWGDREFLEQVKNFGREKILFGVDMFLTRSPSSTIKNATSKLDKRGILPEHIILIDSRINKPDPNKKILTFNWIRLV